MKVNFSWVKPPRFGGLGCCCISEGLQETDGTLKTLNKESLIRVIYKVRQGYGKQGLRIASQSSQTLEAVTSS